MLVAGGFGSRIPETIVSDPVNVFFVLVRTGIVSPESSFLYIQRNVRKSMLPVPLL